MIEKATMPLALAGWHFHTLDEIAVNLPTRPVCATTQLLVVHLGEIGVQADALCSTTNGS